jgi:hypothetical protein
MKRQHPAQPGGMPVFCFLLRRRLKDQVSHDMTCYHAIFWFTSPFSGYKQLSGWNKISCFAAFFAASKGG